MTKTEKVANGREDVRRLGVIPVHFDEDFAVVVFVIDFKVEAKGVVNLHHGDARFGVMDQTWAENAAARLDEPEMCDCTGALEISKESGLPRLDDERILIESGLIPT